jgi:hypothetical protein
MSTARVLRHRRAARAGRGAALLLVTVLLTGCGSGPTPQEWAGQVCDALTPFRARIADLNAQAQQRIAATSTPSETRASLLSLLQGGQDASEAARTAVVAAGTPDVAGGQDVANRFAGSLASTRDAYAHARADLQKLSTDDAAAFYDGVAGVLTTLNAEYTKSGVDTAGLESVELRQAFDKVDRCR